MQVPAMHSITNQALTLLHTHTPTQPSTHRSIPCIAPTRRPATLVTATLVLETLLAQQAAGLALCSRRIRPTT